MSKADRVHVQPYDSTWPTLFDAEAARVQHASSDNCVAIHHVGSTSVPGLVAKPKIDIIAVVRHLFFDLVPLQAIDIHTGVGLIFPCAKALPSERRIER